MIEKDEFSNFVTWVIAREIHDYFARAGNTCRVALRAWQYISQIQVQFLDHA